MEHDSDQSQSDESPPVGQERGAGERPTGHAPPGDVPPATMESQQPPPADQPHGAPYGPPTARSSMQQPPAGAMQPPPAAPMPQPPAHPSPPADVIEGPDEVTVVVDLPGWDRDEIHIEAEGYTLTITAEREPEYDEDETVLQRERPDRVWRVIELPVPANVGAATATYDDGVCVITLPKREEQQRIIAIE